MRPAGIFLSVSLLMVLPIRASAFKLGFPVDCILEQDCIIQNYVDLDPGEGWRDFNCGVLTYDGHKGTDFRIRDYRAMAAGVSVLAAADGLVLGTRNDMDDRLPGQSYEDYLEKISGKECGNGVVLAHEQDYQTQYCHLKKGSVTVKKGGRVKEGEVLGAIGMSGKTQFPHLHLSVRRGTEVIGPFSGRCSDSEHYLRKNPPGYTDTHLLKYGFSDVAQTLESIEEGNSPSFNSSSEALLFWVNLVGVKKGDRQEITIRKPDGSQLARNFQVIEQSKVNWLSFVGKKRPRGGWAKGVYTAVYNLQRDGKPIVTRQASVRVL